jgi:hypothetical protein
MSKKNIKLLSFFIFFAIVFLHSGSGLTGSRQSSGLNGETGRLDPAGKPDLISLGGNLPLTFIPNRGQFDSRALCAARTSHYTLWVTGDSLVFDSLKAVSGDMGGPGLIPGGGPAEKKFQRQVTRLRFLNSGRVKKMIPQGETGHRVNYFIGDDPAGWRTNIETSEAVVLNDLYPQIDLKIYGTDRQIEYDWIVHPDGEVSDIRFDYESVLDSDIDEEGNLVVTTDFGNLMHRKPVGYQEIDGRRMDVDVNFKNCEKNSYQFAVEDYRRDYPLIIDPVVVVYSSYLGGGSSDIAKSVAVDSQGCAYVTGYTNSADFPTAGAYDAVLSSTEIFVTKFNADGDGLVYSTYLGGSSVDYGHSIAVDASGSAYITGFVWSTNYPTVNAYQAAANGQDAVVTKLSSNGGSLVYSTYLGGGSSEEGGGITVDSSGCAYVTGYTTSTDFPTLGPIMTDPGDGKSDAFVTKFAAAGNLLVYSTYLGGSGTDIASGIAVDGAGCAYITGNTNSTDFPLQNAYDSSGDSLLGDAFVAKLSAAGSTLGFSTYLGGSKQDLGNGIAVDPAGCAYVVGDTSSTNFPVVNGFMSDPGDNYKDAFVTKFSAGGSSLVYSTYLGGNHYDYGRGIGLDGEGHAYVTGETYSTDFPTKNHYMTDPGDGDGDVYVTKLGWSGSSLVFSTYIGGADDDKSKGIAVHNVGCCYITGETDSTDYPTVGPYQTDQGSTDAFVTKLFFEQLDDFLGTWTGQGVFYWDPYAEDWYKLGSPADKITCGRLDGDETEDLIGIWPAQGGVWTRYSQSGSWSRLSSTADWIAAGDMNGDGLADLLGTWAGQGVFYRNSATGAWVQLASPATKIICGDMDADGTSDLIGIWPAQGGVWAKYSSTGNWQNLGSTADWISAGDMNKDGCCDLLGSWAGQGVFYRNSQNGNWVQLASAATQVTAGEMDGDGQDDLVGIWPAQGGVWVKSSIYGTWKQISSTADWIACGVMHSQAAASPGIQTASVLQSLEGPVIDGSFVDGLDLGPGGSRFVYRPAANPVPGQDGSLEDSAPGPGQPGFRFTAEKNLIPRAAIKAVEKGRPDKK